MVRRLLIVVFGLALLISNAFGSVPVGAWRDHLSYRSATNIAVAGDKVFCAAGAGMIIYNKSDKSLEKLSKVNGLSDVGISAVSWSDQMKVLVVGYENGNIDLVSGNRIINLSDILRSSVSGSRSINSIKTVGKLAYLSCSFGIVVVNLEKNEIGDTYFLGSGGVNLTVYDTAFDGFSLYAATSSGIFTVPIDAPNLLDFSYWSRLDFLPESGALFPSLAWFGNRLYAAQMTQTGNYVVFEIEEGTWNYFAGPTDNPLSLREYNDYLVVLNGSYADIYRPGPLFYKRVDDYGLWGIDVSDLVMDPDGFIWIADRLLGLVMNSGDNYNLLTPSGPFSNSVFSVTAYAGRAYTAAGGYNSALGNLFKNGEYSLLSDRSWTSRLNYDIRDVIYVKEHPGEPGRQLLATWGYGLVEYRNGVFHERYNESNSTLRSIIPGGDFIRVGGIAFDGRDNLWLTNEGVPDPVSVMKPDGEWLSFPYGSLINHDHTGNMIINRLGQKWVLLPRGGGLFVFDNGNSLQDTSDDLTRRLSITDENNNLISNEVFSIAEDHNGYIWVGTNSGVVVYYNPSRVFSDDIFFARRIVVSGTREEELGYLLNNETVTSIAVDGADRKWFGTEKSGVFLISADGKQQVHNFTMHNSPLLSNTITDIAIDPSTGEVYFGTSAGLLSFRSDATSPADGFKNVYVFPNPVRENYDGPVTVTGLMKDSVVKITDITGNLVWETVSLGGQAVWDGRNSRGRRVQTGIYLVFFSSPDGAETHVTKLMFIH